MRLAAVTMLLAACGDNAAAVDATPRADATTIDALAIDAAPMGPPDLTLVAAKMDGTIVITQDTFTGASCEVLEQCVGNVGPRRLLRFDTVTANLGVGDLVLGPPPAAGVSNDTFQWSPCHAHHHVPNFASYELRDANGLVQSGHKQAFCLQDVEQIRIGDPSRGYNCNLQGLSVGWADVYDSGLACQWIDITDVAPGTYTLHVEINGLGQLPDSDLTNNAYMVVVTI